jgi:NADH dehydrogenase FAD-containing subunit
MLLDSKITVIDDRMVNIERNSQYIILTNGTKVPYETLVLTMGLQDMTLRELDEPKIS